MLLQEIDTALKLFDGELNCAQTVVAMFCEKYGLDMETAMKISCGMGGGFRSGEICGAAAGGVFIIGLASDKEKCNQDAAVFMKRFKETMQYGTCSGLLGNNDACLYETSLGRRRKPCCYDAVITAITILNEMGY